MLALLCGCYPVVNAERTMVLAEEALQLARSVGSPFTRAYVGGMVGMARLVSGGSRTVVRGHLEEALSLTRSLDADWLTMFTLEILATLAEVEGQHAEASALFHEALPLVEPLGDRTHAANIYAGLAQIAFSAGDQTEAATHWRTGLLLAQEVGSALAATPSLAGTAGLLSVQQRAGQAAQLLAATEALREAVEQNPLYDPHFQAAFTPALTATQAALNLEAFAQAWAAGQALSVDQATDLALAELASTPPSTNPASPAGA